MKDLILLKDYIQGVSISKQAVYKQIRNNKLTIALINNKKYVVSEPKKEIVQTENNEKSENKSWYKKTTFKRLSIITTILLLISLSIFEYFLLKASTKKIAISKINYSSVSKKINSLKEENQILKLNLYGYDKCLNQNQKLLEILEIRKKY